MRAITIPLRSGATLHVEVAETVWTRFLGLMGRRSVPADRGLLLMRCSSVHMCFMRLALDVVYLDAAFAVTKIAPDVRPWRFSAGGRGAKHTIEVPAGSAGHLGIEVGDTLRLYTVDAAAEVAA